MPEHADCSCDNRRTTETGTRSLTSRAGGTIVFLVKASHRRAIDLPPSSSYWSRRRWWAWYATVFDLLWTGPLTDALADAVVIHAGRPNGLTVDVGCGTGLITQQLVNSGHDVVSLDSSHVMARRLARRLPDTSVIVGSVDRLPLRPASASTVVATNLLHMHPQPEHALIRLIELLEPSGRLLCSWPRTDTGPWRIARAEHHVGLSAGTIIARTIGRIAIGLASPISAHRNHSDTLRTCVADLARKFELGLTWVDLPLAEQTLAVLRMARPLSTEKILVRPSRQPEVPHE